MANTNITDKDITDKYKALQEDLKACGRIAIAFSGGVDSTFLLRAARDSLGTDRVLAITATSCFYPGRESREASDWCAREGIRQIIEEFDVLSIAEIRQNPPDRCYLCKRRLFEKMLSIAKAEGIPFLAEGSNMDDTGDYRPGMRAIEELGILSPLRRAGLFKEEIRILSKEMNLPTWDKPSFACLASRFVYGETITEERLSMVDRAEQVLLDLGFAQFRVRIHQDLARIEVLPDDFGRLLAEREHIYGRLKKIGFSYVAMDLMGYRTGSMNETIVER